MVSNEASSYSVTFGCECFCPMKIEKHLYGVAAEIQTFEPYSTSTSFSKYMCIYCHSTSHKSSSCLLYYCGNCMCYHPRQTPCPRYKTHSCNLRATASSSKHNWRNKIVISLENGFSAKHWKKKKNKFSIKSKSCPPRL